MARPRVDDLIRAVIAGIELEIAPELQTGYARQSARLCVTLLQQVIARIEREELALVEDNADLRTVLPRLAALLHSCTANEAVEACAVAALDVERALGRDGEAAERTSSLAAAAAESEALRELLDHGLRLLNTHTQGFDAAAVQRVREEVHAYLGRQLQRDASFIPEGAEVRGG